MGITDFLRKDHREVEKLFDRFDNGEDTSAEIVAALQRHDKIEMNVLYPAIDANLPDLAEDLRHAKDEHAEIREKIDLVLAGRAAQDESAHREFVNQLMDVVKHHVKEEENELFPRVEEGLGQEKRDQLGVEAEASKF